MAPVNPLKSMLWLLWLLPASLLVNAARPATLEEAAVQPRGIFTRERRLQKSQRQRASLAEVVRQRQLQQAEARAARLTDDLWEPPQFMPSSLADVSEVAEAGDREARVDFADDPHGESNEDDEFGESEAPTRQSMDLEGEGGAAEEKASSPGSAGDHTGSVEDEQGPKAPSPHVAPEPMDNDETAEASHHVEDPTEHETSPSPASGEVFVPGVSDNANANLLNTEGAPSPSTEGLGDFSFGPEPHIETKDLFKATGQEGRSLNEAAESIDKKIHSVDQAIDKIHGAMDTYHQSINGLSNSFGDLRKMAGEMKVGMNGEFEERERQRLCSFENLDKMLKGEAYVPCDKTPRLANNNVATEPSFEETPAAGVKVNEVAAREGMHMFAGPHDAEHAKHHASPAPATPHVDGDAATGEAFVPGVSDDANANLLGLDKPPDQGDGITEQATATQNHDASPSPSLLELQSSSSDWDESQERPEDADASLADEMRSGDEAREEDVDQLDVEPIRTWGSSRNILHDVRLDD